MNKLIAILPIFLTIMSIGCRKPALETQEAPVMIKGYLFGGDSINDFYVERIATSREFENEKNIPITEGTLNLIHGDEVIELSPDPSRPGYFVNHEYIVEPNSAYTMEAQFENSHITAKCYVPEFPILEEEIMQSTTLQVGGMGVDNSEELFSFSWSEGSEFLIDLKPEEENPIELTFSDDLGKFDNFYALPIKDNSASLFSEDFTYAGRHTITIFSISPEYSDFVRYAPTSFERSVYRAPNNIEGAYGVFAGLTGTTLEIIIEQE